ncbi:nuclear transport factor 2 family protein [Elioraea sp.]|uniref:nuclear transport factor 2 family protein n=1 Tax=Elioraea sp. TaxID=2185103 RepID=UPI0025BF2817|nr:nuclear transport factor 2 family protein [Elioraea sp.]
MMDGAGATQREALIARVQRFVLLSMAKDPEASSYLAPGAVIVFTGGRHFAAPQEVGRFNAARYAHVAKRIERWDVAPDAETGGLVVYCLGVLHGAWPDGRSFDGNRFVDRMVVRPDGLIVRADVWNDSAERMLDPALDGSN